MTPKSAKAKGKVLENYVADRIVALGLDPRARRDGASGAGNREKGDISTSLMILGQNAGIECKNHASPHVSEWWRQTKKLESLGREPVLAYKLSLEPFDQTKVIIYLETFLEIVKLANAAQGIAPPAGDSQDDRDRRYKIDRAVHALKDVLKALE